MNSTTTDTGTPQPSTSPSWWRRNPRWAAFAVVAVVLVLIGAAVIVSQDSEFDDTVSGPVAEAQTSDDLPDEPIVTDIDDDCGVSAETVEQLVPDGDRHNMERDEDEHRRCTWNTGGFSWSPGGSNRELEVEVEASGVTETPEPAIADGITNYTRTLDWEAREDVDTELGQVTAFTGLGDEAVVYDQLVASDEVESDDEEMDEDGVQYRTAHTTVLFRVGNVVVSVGYAGADYRPEEDADLLDDPEEELLDPDSTRGGAMYVAEEIVESMGVEVADSLEAAPTETDPPVLTELPDMCAELDDTALQDVGDDSPDTEDSFLFEGYTSIHDADMDAQRCQWRDEGRLEIDVGVVADERLGGALPTAEREYLLQRYRASATPEPEAYKPDDEPAPDHVFVPLSGLGEAAYASYTDDGSRPEAELTFHKRGLLIRVQHHQSLGDSLEADAALNAVYSTAVEVADVVEDL